MIGTHNKALTTSSPIRRPILSIVAVLSVALLLTFYLPAAHVVARTTPLVTLPDTVSSRLAGAKMMGHHNTSDQMTIGLLLQLNNQAELQNFITSLYNPHSALYHQWLQPGDFAARFGPSSSQIIVAQNFLTQAGLRLVGSPISTLVLATGTSSQVEAAFHTSINDYQSADGQLFFANGTNVQLPANLNGSVIGVLGLNDATAVKSHRRIDGGPASQSSNPPLPSPYGGGPFGRGLTPSQISGIYDADPVHNQLNDRGQGETLAVFELSGYKQSDIGVYVQQFHLPHVPIRNRLVLGGPIPENGSLDYAAGEVELDIELQIAMAPGAKSLLVYNAPNTEIGVVAQYLQIAKDNQADSISTSWGECEYLEDTSSKLGEFQAFAQMATQGQSITASSGDDGAFDCLPYTDSHLTGSNELQVDDPASQPYITGVGGTSFRQPNKGSVVFDPGKNQHPTYPGTSEEGTWNEGCTTSSCEGSGGGVSRYWGSPDYQSLAGQAVTGFIEPGLTQSGSYCNQTAGVFCREVPDVSMDGDPGTGYAIYCTDPGDPGCSSPSFDIHGWIRFGGTSTDAPLWAAIAALIANQNGGRVGLLNYYYYSFDSTVGYSSQLHDITLYNNGHYPAELDYDMSTGVGSPDIFHLVKP